MLKIIWFKIVRFYLYVLLKLKIMPFNQQIETTIAKAIDQVQYPLISQYLRHIRVEEPTYDGEGSGMVVFKFYIELDTYSTIGSNISFIKDPHGTSLIKSNEDYNTNTNGMPSSIRRRLFGEYDNLIHSLEIPLIKDYEYFIK